MRFFRQSNSLSVIEVRPSLNPGSWYLHLDGWAEAVRYGLLGAVAGSGGLCIFFTEGEVSMMHAMVV